jgi:hypothetical protein
MEDIGPEIELPKLKNTGLIAAGISIALILIIILQHNLSFQKTSQTIIPAGNTYLGPPESQSPQPTPAAVATAIPSAAPDVKTSVAPGKGVFLNAQGKIAASPDVAWTTVNGKKYPYSFQSPKNLKLSTFPNDAFDIYAIAWENRPPDQNVLIGVDNLNRTEALKQYITLSKRSYVESWWKQFGGLKGVASITEFTNSKGLKGYRAKYLNSANQTPNDDVFFEVANPAYVIHIASGILDSSVFDPLIDSVGWTTKK